MKEIDWGRVGANAIAGFFTGLAAMQAATGNTSWQVALCAALIQAGLAGATELKRETEEGSKKLFLVF